MIRVKLLRPEHWDRAPGKVLTLPKRLHAATNAVIAQVVQEMADQLRATILGQRTSIDIRARQLNAAYAKRKGGKPVLLDTMTYANAIQVVPASSPDGGYGVGLRPASHPRGGTPLGSLAAFLENGTKHMAPIAHWRPTATFGTRLLTKRLTEQLSHALRID